jgi:hypothetical protein
MTDSRVAPDPNRLPWLADERKPRRKGEWTALALAALLVALAVAGVSFWLGARNASEADDAAGPVVRTLPAPSPLAPAQPTVEQPRADEVKPAPVPVVEPAPERSVRIAAPEPVRKAEPAVAPSDAASSKASAAEDAPPAAEKKTAVAPAPAKPIVARPVAKPGPLRLWPSIVSDGANGRVVRIGAYGSRLNAKKGWFQIVSRYPGMRRLRAVVAPVPAPGSGRTYYRLQFGTTSQAHSEVLCQRMHAIRKTCAVVGLPPSPRAVQARGRR